MRVVATEREDVEFPAREELSFITGRLALLAGVIVLILSLYAAQLYKLTILRGPEYQKFSENNFLLSSPLVPPRGRLVDSKGASLAVNQLFYEVVMSPYKLKPIEIKVTLERLA